MYYILIFRKANEQTRWQIAVNDDLVKLKRGFDDADSFWTEGEGWEKAPESLTGQAFAAQILTESISDVLSNIDLENITSETIEVRVVDDADVEWRSIIYTILEDRINFAELVNGHIWTTDEFVEGTYSMKELVQSTELRMVKWIENEMKGWK